MSSQQRTRTSIYSVQWHGVVSSIEILRRALCEGEGGLFRQACDSHKEDEKEWLHGSQNRLLKNCAVGGAG
jgi:hypothetical protein